MTELRFQGELEGMRPRGRPQKRWIDNLNTNLLLSHIHIIITAVCSIECSYMDDL